MAVERERVLKAILHYRECFEYFKKVGLYKPGGIIFGFPGDDNVGSTMINTGGEVVKRPEAKTIIRKRVNDQDPSQTRRSDDGGQSERKKNQIVSLVDDHGNTFVPQLISESKIILSMTFYRLCKDG